MVDGKYSMLINSEGSCRQFIANDGCKIRELLHPKNDPIALGFSLASAEIAAGQASYRHRLAQAEVYYIVSGTGEMHIGEEVQAVQVGDAVFIPAHETQWIKNIGSDVLKFIAIVAPPWCSEDDVRL
ncbi:MAG: mannose-6-phosphate isomerase-like protein (cupin superfamily) [Gammaproteobacteria bacterium]